ncbi:uncharacterized protein BX663DRAFT_547977 [Cokeromyces recurvatus]|uniref:uncharacterized protein n=1 Tax=Cokeromyces recurvatus TaxID=90255 RepID=UPI0022210706|nr:uncharacterized protein BX663DRAFT_547977 [Cokeromyces recurvatus]KAI7906868.1 hypothetical protein BX663DRAFT_547977 [Cokeromyces recurvatus]
MEEEEEICRVCRSESTSEQPLFHPCKCAGSIKYVHQECLIEWLSHSRKKYCELCGHPFTFTPVYSQDMPEVLPARLFLKQLQKKTLFVISKTLRAILVSSIWLVLLPYFTIWIWRLYFFLGSHFGKHFIKLQNMRYQFAQAKNISVILDSYNYSNETITANWLQTYNNRFTLRTFLSDCFEGQIITCIVVVIFVAIFLLREWIVQNIPMDPPPVEDDNNFILDQPAERMIQDEQVFGNNNDQRRIEGLLNGSWEQEERNEIENDLPSSPIALNDRIWFGEAGTSSSDSIMHSNHIESSRPPRAASMPPSLSIPTSFDDDETSENNLISQLNREQINFQKSMSMELFVDNRLTTGHMPSYQNQILEQNHALIPAIATTHRGYPPNAPRIRHAEAPTSSHQPILEEEENEQENRPFVQAPIQPIDNHNVNEGDNNDDNEEEEEEDDDDDDENIEEFEGILEAIGMQGSLWSLAQNCALIAVLIALCLAVTVWMPYVIGMIFIMTDTLEFIRLPLKVVRWATDPLVDYLIMICSNYVKPWLIHTIYQNHLQPISVTISSLPIYNKIIDSFMYIYTFIISNSLLFSKSSDIVLSDQIIPNMTSYASNSSFIFTSVAKFMNETDPIFESAFRRYQLLATGQTAVDRFACILVGYMVATFASCWYLTRSIQQNLAVAAFGRTAQEIIRQQSMIFKVGMFITIELVLFPIVCGFLLDFSTLPLFKAVTLLSRLSYLQTHPIPSIFLHWFLGTGFMFLFAVFVTTCRETVRPGVMWFIRDPNDPQFHPIREIIERPILFQFKKIGASALIYLTVILIGVGSVVHLLDVVDCQILPLRWNLSSPISIMPIDLIIGQIYIPVIVKYFQPKKIMKQLFLKCTAFACRQLRLFSFIFGGRRPEEEGTLVYHTWIAWIKQVKPAYYPVEGSCENVIGNDVSYIWDGQLLRVPRHDSVPIIDRRRMLVPVDNRTFEPIDETERRLGHPAATAAGGNDINTIIVYSPPHFKLRLLVFVIFMWLIMTLVCCSAIISPLLLGRYLFKMKFGVENEVHDIYSFKLGVFILLTLGSFMKHTYKAIKDIISRPNILASVWRYLTKWFLWAFRWVFFLVSFGLIIPFLFGALIEFYTILPLRQIDSNIFSIKVIPLWTQGFVCMNILHGCIQIIPNHHLKHILDNIFQDGIHKMKIKLCIVKLLGPLLLVSLAAIFLPLLTAYINIKIIAQTDTELRARLVQIAYPIALIGITSYYLGKIGTRMTTRLAQNIREDNYLIGRTLHNLDE